MRDEGIKSGESAGPRRNSKRDFHGERRKYETPASSSSLASLQICLPARRIVAISLMKRSFVKAVGQT
jgi:hypothetical protein